MLPVFPRPTISRRQKMAALVVAGVVDFIQLPGFLAFGGGLLSPLEDVLDFVTAMVLVAICGFKWQFVLAFMAELVPGLDLFPTWTMVVATLMTHGEAAEAQRTAGEDQRVRVTRMGGTGVAARGGYEEVEGEVVSVPPVQAPPVRSGR